jgi:HK97 gp10 family phage protein
MLCSVNMMSERIEFPVALKITGLDRIREGLAAAPHELRVVANDVVDKGLGVVEERAEELAPVRTGWLRSQVYKRKTGFLGWELGDLAFYSGFVEFGTRFMRARPFLRPAVEEKMPEVREELKDALIEKMLELLT